VIDLILVIVILSPMCSYLAHRVPWTVDGVFSIWEFVRSNKRCVECSGSCVTTHTIGTVGNWRGAPRDPVEPVLIT
jgi:hypothetical protein